MSGPISDLNKESDAGSPAKKNTDAATETPTDSKGIVMTKDTTRANGLKAPRPIFPPSQKTTFGWSDDHPFADPCPRWCELYATEEAPHVAEEVGAHHSPRNFIRLGSYALKKENGEVRAEEMQVRIQAAFGEMPEIAIGTRSAGRMTFLKVQEARLLAQTLLQFCDIAEDLDYADGSESEG